MGTGDLSHDVFGISHVLYYMLHAAMNSKKWQEDTTFISYIFCIHVRFFPAYYTPFVASRLAVFKHTRYDNHLMSCWLTGWLISIDWWSFVSILLWILFMYVKSIVRDNRGMMSNLKSSTWIIGLITIADADHQFFLYLCFSSKKLQFSQYWTCCCSLLRVGTSNRQSGRHRYRHDSVRHTVGW